MSEYSEFSNEIVMQNASYISIDSLNKALKRGKIDSLAANFWFERINNAKSLTEQYLISSTIENM